MHTSGHSQQNPLLYFPQLNFSPILEESNPSVLHINVTYIPSGVKPPFLLWQHNGDYLDTENVSRYTLSSEGGLTVSSIKPTDSGQYTVIASNGEICQSVHFNVYVECE